MDLSPLVSSELVYLVARRNPYLGLESGAFVRGLPSLFPPVLSNVAEAHFRPFY